MAFLPGSPQRFPHFSDVYPHLSKLRKALTCSLCHQLFQNPACLHCNHHFCTSCLLQFLEGMPACPKCKQPAAARQVKHATEMDNLVDIFRSLESAAQPIVANSEDSQLEDFPDIKNVAPRNKIDDECLSPSSLKKQKRHENKEHVNSINNTTEAGSRKRDASSVEPPCMGVFPAPKRIQLPCPLMPIDRSKIRDASLVKAEMDATTPHRSDPASAGISSSVLMAHQKHPFALARIGGQVRSTGSSLSSQDKKVPMHMGIHGSNDEQAKRSDDTLGEKSEFGGLHSHDHSQERNAVHADHLNQALPGFCKQDIETQAGSTQKQLVDDNAGPNTMLPNQADFQTDKTCAFCHTTDSEVAGPMIHYKKGVPVSGSKKSGQILSVHKNCAEWAPGVYYEDDVAKNIPQEVARGHKIKCNVCGMRGAVLGCYVKRCRKSFHYPCAYSVPCRWDDSNFLVFCPEHVTSRFPDEGHMGTGSKSENPSNSEHREETPKQADGAAHQSNDGVDTAPPVDAYIPQLPAEAEIGKQVPPQQWPSSKWVLCGSGLSPRANEVINSFVSHCGLTIEKAWSSSITHLIVGTDEVGAARRTFKYLMGNLQGKWILKIDWISACMAANHYVNEEPYEVNLDIHGMIGGPCRARGMSIAKLHGLFEGLRFYFLGEYTAAYVADLQVLLTSGGGLVLGQMPDLLERDGRTRIVIIYSKEMNIDTSASHREELNRSRYLEARSLVGMTGAKVAGHTWIMDSVAAYELQPFE